MRQHEQRPRPLVVTVVFRRCLEVPQPRLVISQAEVDQASVVVHDEDVSLVLRQEVRGSLQCLDRAVVRGQSGHELGLFELDSPYQQFRKVRTAGTAVLVQCVLVISREFCVSALGELLLFTDADLAVFEVDLEEVVEIDIVRIVSGDEVQLLLCGGQLRGSSGAEKTSGTSGTSDVSEVSGAERRAVVALVLTAVVSLRDGAGIAVRELGLRLNEGVKEGV